MVHFAIRWQVATQCEVISGIFFLLVAGTVYSRCFLDPFYESYCLLLAALSVSDSGVEGPVAFTDRLAAEFLSAERQLSVNQVSICSS